MGSAAAAQGIVTDGRTATSVVTSGNQTDISTTTVHGGNAYNSFRRFGVDQGSTVNLHVPGQADNLINLVREGRTDIHGTLNGVKNGRIGGGIYLLNPNGIVVGPSGVVNAGSLSLQTPTADFLEGVIDQGGTPNPASVGHILGGTAPVAPGGQISVHGQINTIDGIHLRGGGVDVSGALRAGAAGVAAMQRQVNLGGLRPAANTVHRTRSGAIVIGSPGHVRVSGRIESSGSDGTQGGEISLRAGGNIDVVSGAVITARGFGENSDGGDIVVYAGDTARLASGALIDAGSGASGDGGFVEFSATQLVSLDGGEIRADAPNGQAGIIYIDPADVVYTTDTQFIAAASIVEATNSITLNSNVTLSTTVAVDSLTLRAPHIVLMSGSRITTVNGGSAGDITLETLARIGGDLTTPTAASITVTDATIEGGHITLNATSLLDAGYGIKRASSTITLDGAAITGTDVDILATAVAKSSLLGAFDPDGGTSQSPLSVIGDLAVVAAGTAFAGLPLSAVVAVADADAIIDIRSGTVIDASGDVAINASATADARAPKFAKLEASSGSQSLPAISVVYGSAETTARAVVGSGATIRSNGALEVTAAGETTVDIANTSSTDGQFNATLNFVNVDVDVEARIARGATVDLRNPGDTDSQTVTVSAENAGSYAAATNAVAPGANPSTVLSANWLDVNDSVRAELGADIALADGIVVSAADTIEQIAGGADSSSAEEGKLDFLNDRVQALDLTQNDLNIVASMFLGEVSNKLGSLAGVLETSQTLDVPVQLAGSLSVVKADLDVVAEITADSVSTQGLKPGGDPQSSIGDIAVTADVEIGTFQNMTSGGTEAKDSTNTSIALAIPITTIDIDNRALVAPGVVADVSETLSVEANTALIHDPDWLAVEGASDVLSKLSGDAGLRNVFLSSGAFATFEEDAGSGKTLGLAANVDLFDIAASTVARVGGLDTALAQAEATSVNAGRVAVVANSTVQSAHASGNVGDFMNVENALSLENPFEAPGGGTASTGAGGTFQGVTYDVTTTAEIGDRVTVAAIGGVSVEAEAESVLVTIGASGLAGMDDPADVSAVGVVIINSVASTTLARVGTGSVVTTSGGAADIAVRARDDLSNWSFVGGLVTGQNVGFGASVGINKIDLSTVAEIDGADRIAAARDVIVDAVSDGSSNVLALAGAITTSKRDSDGSGGKTSPAAAGDSLASGKVADGSNTTGRGGTQAVEANSGGDGANSEDSAGAGSNAIAEAISAATGKFGIAVAGDAAVNVISLATKGEIRDVAVLEARDVKVQAASDVDAFAGAGAFAFQSFKDPSQPNTATIGVAGAYAHNAFDGNRIEAVVANIGRIDAARDVLIAARNTQGIISGAASGSGQTRPASGNPISASIAGAATFNTFTDAATLAELSDSEVGAGRDIAVTARDTSSIHTGAGAATISLSARGLGIGAAGSVNISDADTVARIVSTTILSSQSVKAEASADRDILAVAIALAAQGTNSNGLTLGGSFSYNSIGGSVLAEIVDGAVTSGGGVDVLASEESDLVTVSGEAAINGRVGIGIAVAAASLLGNAHARLSGTTVNAERLAVKAVTDRTSIAVAVGASATKNGVALKGSVVVNQSGNADAADGREGTIAEVDGGATITVTGDVDVGAAERTNMQSYAGGFAGGRGGLGASVAINKADGEVTARMADASVLDAGAIKVRAVSGAGNVDDTSSRTQLIAVAAQASAGGVALAGAAVVNQLDTRTTAEVAATATLGSQSQRVGSVTVRADDRSVAGSGAIGFVQGSTSLSAAIAVDLLDKRTTARLSGETHAAGDVIVDARSSMAAYGGLVALAIGGQTSVGVAAGIAYQNNTTLAEIGAGTTVHAGNNVHVNAEDKGDVIRATIATGLASVQTQESTTTARIGEGAQVTALAGGSGIAVRTGQLSGGIAPGDGDASGGSTTSADADLSSVNDNVGGRIAGNVQATNSQSATSNAGAENVDATAALGAQTALTETVGGVAVTANSDQRMINLGLGVSVAGLGLGGAATVSTIKGDTTAEIGRDARINTGDGTAGAGQDVVVRAKTNGLTVDTAVGVAVGGSIGVGAGVDVVRLEKSTTAKIGRGAVVAAECSITVEADNRDKVVGVASSLVGTGTVGLAGAVGIATLSNTASATVEDGTNAADAARLTAGGSIAVVARNRADTFHLVGSVGVAGSGGLGVGVSIVNAETVTTARLGAYSIADAAGDLAVAADADTRMKSVSIAFAGGGTVGVAAGVSVKSLKTRTLAEIGTNARINRSGGAASATQSVFVTSRDATDLLSVVGAGAAGIVGIGAGVDIITLRGSSVARIADGAEVAAANDILVDAQLDKRIDGYTVTAGLGGTGAGIGGAVTIIKAGGALTSKQRQAIGNQGGSATAATQVAGLTGGSGGVVDGAGFGNASGASQAVASANASQASGNTSADIVGTDPVLTAGNDAVAEIGDNAVVTAGDDIAVSARNVTEVDMLTGGVGVGLLAGAGAGLAFIDVNTLVSSRIGAGARVTAGGNLDVSATDGDDSVESTVKAFAGAGGGFVGLGAVVVDFDFTTTTQAVIANGAVISLTPDADQGDGDDTGALTVVAAEKNRAAVESYGATVGGLAAVGAQIADLKKSGTVRAEVVDAATAPQGADITAGTIDIAAIHGGALSGEVYGGTASIGLAVGYIELDIHDDVDVTARLGDHARLEARDRLVVETTSAPRVSAAAYGGIGAGIGAVGITEAEARADIVSRVETGVSVAIVSQGDVKFLARTAQAGGETAEAEAVTGSGALGIGFTAVEARTVVAADTAALIGADNTFAIDNPETGRAGSLEISSQSDVAADTDARGGAGGAIAIGAVNARSNVANTTRTVIAAGSGGTIDGAVRITSQGRESLDSRTVGGAGGLIAGASAKADNVLVSTTTTTFQSNAQGDGFTGGAMTVSANHADGRVLANTDARAGYLVGKTGAYSTNAAASTVAVDVGDNVLLSAGGPFLMEAANRVTKAADGDAAYAASGGVAGGAAAKSSTQFWNSVDVSIGGADIRVRNDDSIFTTNDLTIRANSTVIGDDAARLDTGGAIAVARSESRIVSGSASTRDHADVTVAGGAVIWNADGDVRIGARTDAAISTSANAKTYGVAGAAEGRSESRIFASSAVEIGAGARIYAEESIAVRAGADDRGSASVATIARTRLWNRTVIPIDTDPKADAESNVLATVSVASGTRLSAVRSIELTADAESVSADGFGRGQDLYQEALAAIGSFFSGLFGGGPVTIETTYRGSHKTALSSIDLDSTEVKAGFKHHQILEFAELPTLVDSDDPDAAGVQIRYYVPALDIDGNPIKSEGITYSIENNVSLETRLRQAIIEQTAVINAFDGDTVTRLAMQNDLDVLLERYAKLVGSKTVDFDGETLPSLEDVIVDFIIVDDVTARTGDVAINTQRFDTRGATSLIAPGDTKIEITNNSAAFLQIGDLTIPEEEGGRIFFNGAIVENKARLDTLNSLGSTAGLTLESSIGSGAPGITVINNYGSRPGQERASDLISSGHVYNPSGNVTMTTAGNLDVSGTIRSATINLSAGKDFTNAFTFGFFHVGGLPRAQFDGVASPHEDQVYNPLINTATASSSLAGFNFNTPSFIVAAGDVFISAERVNVNGLVQSGIARQYSTVEAAQAQKVAQIREAYEVYEANQATDWNSRPDALYASFMGVRFCTANCSTLRERLIGSFQADGKSEAAVALATLIDTRGTTTLFDLVPARNVFIAGNPGTADINQRVNRIERQVGAVYNLATNEIEIDNAVASGGRVQIFGELLSTGGGQINVLDGFANIDIRNDTSLAMVVNKVDTGGTLKQTETGDTTGGRAGRIRLIDPRFLVDDPTGKTNPDGSPLRIARVVDYIRQNGVVVAFDNVTVDDALNPNNAVAVDNAEARSATVTPAPSLSHFGWTTAQWEVDIDQAIYRKSVGQAFGLSLGKLGDLLSKDPSNLYLDPPPVPQGLPVPILVPVDTDGDGVNDSFGESEYLISDSGDYNFDFQRVNVTSSTTKTTNDWCSKRVPVLGCFRRTYQTIVTTTNGNELYYRHSVPANQTIGLGFIGYDQGAINVTSAGDIILNDRVSNVIGTTSIASTGGDILQRSAVARTTADILDLSAMGRIGGETVGQGMAIDAVANGASRLAAVAGGDIHLAERRGNLRYSNVTSGSGDVRLTAESGIVQTSAAGAIRGRNIDLVANAGSIGSAAQTVNLDTGDDGKLNARSAADIVVTELAGDLNVDTVKAAGDVTVTVNDGSLIDANPNDIRDIASENELLRIWDENALLDSPEARASRDASVAAARDKAKNDYDFYWAERGAGAYDPGYRFTFSAAEVAQMTASGLSASQIDEAAAEKTATYHVMNSIAGSAPPDPAFTPTQVIVGLFKKDGRVVPPSEPGATKVYEAVDIAEAATGYAWEQVDLENGISKNLLSNRGDTTTVIEDPNFEAANLTINVLDGEIGRTNGSLRIERKPDGSPADLTDELKIAIAAAERDDYTFGDGFIDIARREDVDIKVSGTVEISAKSNAFIGSETSDINIVRARSETQDIRIKTGGGITNAAAAGDAAVEAGNVILESSGGSIGSADNPLPGRIGGNLTARAASGDVYFDDRLGDLDIDFVLAGGTAALTSAGSIVDARGDGDVNVRAAAISFEAAQAVGSALNAFEVMQTAGTGLFDARARAGAVIVNATDLTLRVGTITATGDIGLVVANGSLIGGAMTATGGGVNLTSSADIALGDITATAGIVATAASGGITQANGRIASAGGDVSLIARDDIVLGSVRTASASATAMTITSTAGGIVDGGDAHLDIVANAAGARTALSAATGIGSGNALETQIDRVTATNRAGGSVGLAESDGLVVERLTQSANADATVSAGGDLSVAGPVTAPGAVGLASGGSLSVGAAVAGSRLDFTSARDMTILASLTAASGPAFLSAGGDFAMTGNVTATKIAVTAGGNADFDGVLATGGGAIDLAAGRDLTLSRSAILASVGGDITLTADGGTGDQSGALSQLAGSGRIDAGDGILTLRAGRVRLENPLIASSMRFQSSSGGASVQLGTISVGDSLDIEARSIIIGELIHTGTGAPLRLDATGSGGGMADLIDLNIVSAAGVEFGILSTRVARIFADTDRLEFRTARIGERALLSNNAFLVLLDNTTPAIQQAGVQLYQARAGEDFYLLLDRAMFSTGVDTLKIDRWSVTRANLPGQPLQIMSDDVLTFNGVILSRATGPLADMIAANAGVALSLPPPPAFFLAVFANDADGQNEADVNGCERSQMVNVNGIGGCN